MRRDWCARSLLLALLVAQSACAGALSPEALRDPESCKSCHPDQYRAWSGSMHAYATDDPVFLAMVRRGQRETGGALGDQCMRCHGPLVDGDPETTPRHLRGVTCFVCHAMGGDPDAPRHERDIVLRGGIVDPAGGAEHGAAYSATHDRNDPESSKLCAHCHERTFREWEDSVFNSADPQQNLTCGQCHMRGRNGLAADVDGVPLRRVHDHSFVGAGVSLIDWPEQAAQREAIQRELDPSIYAQLCVSSAGAGALVQVTLDNVASGHQWPTGSTLSRRAWVEVIAYDGDTIAFESGRVPETESIVGRRGDPALWLLRTRALDGDGDEVRMPWRASSFERELLPPGVTNDASDPRFSHAVTRLYQLTKMPDRVSLRVRLRPLGLDVMNDLVQSGDLDPLVATASSDFTLGGTVLEWTTGDRCVPGP